MKTIELQLRIIEIMKSIEFQTRIPKIIKINEFQAKIKNDRKSCNSNWESQQNHENHKISVENP